MEGRVYPSHNNGGAAQNNNGYKGFSSYNYPLQQPDSPQTPRKRRCRSSCKCCCWSLFIFLILLCVGAALVYFLMKPRAPKYRIDDAAIAELNMTAQNHINMDVRFTVVATNPNKAVEFYFGNMSVDASYDGTTIGRGTVGAFQQKHESTLLLPVRVQGRDIAVRGSAATSLKKALAKKGTALDLTLKAKTTLKVKIGSLKSWGQKVKLSCLVSIESPSKPGKAVILSSSCKLKN